MSREIKLQLVWQGCIYESLTLQELIKGDWEIYGKRFKKHDEYNKIGEEVSIPAKDYRYFSEVENDYGVWREYTGLKDKNGVEIYEGDIVEFTFGSRGRIVGKIKFDHHGAYIKTDYSLRNSGLFQRLSNDLEIIGNIYENPNLIDNK